MTIEIVREHACFGGVQGLYSHASSSCSGNMQFAVYSPPQARDRRVPVLVFLSGLTCNEETFAIKAGAQRLASELGLMLVTPDTSPRDTGIPGAIGDWEFGEAASYYVDATIAPWSSQFRMESYVARELPALIAAEFNADLSRCGISGHSVGGHGALTLALRHPQVFRSLSAFAPMVSAASVPWGRKALPQLLGDEAAVWAEHDACALIGRGRYPGEILIDQGLADKFLDSQLQPERFETACAAIGQPLQLRRHAGYDHGYYFIQSFVDDHLRHHARALAITS